MSLRRESVLVFRPRARMLIENTKDLYTNGHFRHAGRRVFAGVDRLVFQCREL